MVKTLTNSAVIIQPEKLLRFENPTHNNTINDLKSKTILDLDYIC